MSQSKRKSSRGASYGFALIPFIICAVGIFFFTRWFLGNVLEENAYFSLLVNDAETANEEIVISAGEFTPAAAPAVLYEIPEVAFGQQWARLNVSWDGGSWSIKDIPVYLGADKSILKVGVGMSFGSSFPGEKGRCIISAHVTRHFAQLEDTPMGAIVTLETLYGTYRYRVTDMQTFVGTERAMITASNADNKLIMYTCYPRDNGGHRRTQRCALICERIEGLEVTP